MGYRDYFVVNSFHIQILAISLLFCAKSPGRQHFAARLILSGAAYCALPFLLPDSYFNRWLRVGDWFTFGFLVMLVLAYFLLRFCFALSPKESLFYVCTAHTIQHIIHCFSCAAECALQLDSHTAQWVQLAAAVLITAGSVFFLRKQLADSGGIDLKNTGLLGFAVFSTALIYYLSFWTVAVETETVGVYLFDMFCCILLLMLLFDMFRERRMQKEKSIMLHLLQQEQRHHEMSAANVEVINRKCHDLKHQISALRQMEPGEKEESIQELERAVLIYDSLAKTGSRDLDLLLAEKCLVCEERGIKLQYMVDGARLAFLKAEDLYALFGNAIDNAIESVSKLADSQIKIITLQAAPRANCVVVRIDNPCPEPVRFLDGLPVTTKADRDYHGYGMRSMRYITEKYGGTLTAQYRDGLFVLNLLFPER